jgi:transposase-like protein
MAGRGKGKGSRRSRQDWRSLLTRFDGSGLGVEAFCRREAISAASFYRWRRLFGEGGSGCGDEPREPAPAFLDLGTLTSAGSSRPRIDLRLDLGDGLVLHLVRN